MGKVLAAGLLLAWASGVAASGVVGNSVAAEEKSGVRGFSDPAAAAQLALEAAYEAGLEAANLDKWMKHLSARPHHVGSPWGKQNAEYMASLFAQDGGHDGINRGLPALAG